MKGEIKEAYFSKTFFERLADPDTKRSVVTRPDLHDVVASIKYNLYNILNSRAGHSQSAPELGLLDFNDATIGSSDLALKVTSTIGDCICQFEPRIESVNITLESDNYNPLNLKFKIVATLDKSLGYQVVEIDILCDSNKKYNIR